MDYFINYYQSPDERKAKYALCRKLGLSRARAIQFRDFSWSTLVQHLPHEPVSIWLEAKPFMSKPSIRKLNGHFDNRRLL